MGFEGMILWVMYVVCGWERWKSKEEFQESLVGQGRNDIQGMGELAQDTSSFSQTGGSHPM